MQASRDYAREARRAKLATDVEAFLAGGGEIHDVQPEENRWYKDKGNPRRAPLTITQSQQQHRWRPRISDDGKTLMAGATTRSVGRPKG